MREYLPILILGAIIGMFTLIFVTAYLLEKNKKGGVAPRTAHSLNPVPFIVYDPAERHELKEGNTFGLANVAPTIVDLMGLEPFASWEASMLKK